MGKLLNANQREQIEQISQNHPSKIKQRIAKILLLYDLDYLTKEVSQQVHISRSRARYWKRQFVQYQMQIFNIDINKLGDLNGMESKTAIIAGDHQINEFPSQEQDISTEENLALSPSVLSRLAKSKSPGITVEDTLSEAGRKVLRYHFIQMMLHESGTLSGEDIEDLHDMRVATRRMRAAFDVFDGYFQSKLIKPFLKSLRATGRALGSVRDMDVFIEKTHLYAQTYLHNNQDDLLPLISTWEEQREAKRKKMIAFLNKSDYLKFKDSFFTFLNTPGLGSLTSENAGSKLELVRDIVPVLIYDRLAAVRSFDAIIANASFDQLHSLRIDLKKLRYTLEFFSEVLGEDVLNVISEIKKIQDHLGDLNDTQIATQILRDFLTTWDLQQEKLPVDQRRNPDPLIAYLACKYQERQNLLTSFNEVWLSFNKPELRHKIALAIAVL